MQVRLRNEDVDGGVTLHWHGVDVPNAEDGVAGVTQDAVPVGGSHVYRFVVPDAGTYWYHSHQVSHEQVRGGLFGTLVVHPAEAPASTAAGPDVLAVVHTYDGRRTVNGRTEVSRAEVPGGSTTRVRVVNTDSGAARVWVSAAPYRILAVDGYDIEGGTDVVGKVVLVPAGGRVDLAVDVPTTGTRVDVGGGTALVLGPRGGRVVAEPEPQVDGRPAVLRPVLGRPALRPAAGGPALRLRHRSPDRLPRRPPRLLVDDQRPPVPGRADVRRRRG